jgi:hypothetical protein
VNRGNENTPLLMVGFFNRKRRESAVKWGKRKIR